MNANLLTCHLRYSILCSDYAIKKIDEPFVKDEDDVNEWAL